MHPIVASWFEPVIATVNATWPSWSRIVLTAQQGEFGYGLLNMGPFLLATFSALWREASGTVKQFLFQAMPIFVAICLAASLLAHFGVRDLAS
ncbi:MAG: hypothetical protein MI861_10180 [Pirellulales bacterium]|nr:hypothetical protein [Pirellulales bacterium]